MHEARFYAPDAQGNMRCALCPHHCVIAVGKTGLCGVRRHQGGKLETLVWGKLIAAHVDPVEKKPLFHFHPGTPIFSVAAVGCNFRCRHCQNADISQMPRDRGEVAGADVSPRRVVARAIEAGCRSMAYTYTEPTIYFEYAFDMAVEARAHGLKNVFVTNGYIESEPLAAIAPYLDAANIDLKSFSDEFYRQVCGARLQPVLDAIVRYHRLGIWIELTTLLIPGLNDAEEELRSIARFIRELSPDIPWHVSRFHPDYRMTDRPDTPAAKVQRAWEIGREEGLHFVYQGNVTVGSGENTDCPRCGRVVVEREGFSLGAYRIKNGSCEYCGQGIAGVGL